MNFVLYKVKNPAQNILHIVCDCKLITSFSTPPVFGGGTVLLPSIINANLSNQLKYTLQRQYFMKWNIALFVAPLLQQKWCLFKM